MSIPTTFNFLDLEEFPHIDLSSEYAAKLSREGVVGCTPSIAARWVTHHVVRKPDGTLAVVTKCELSDSGWYLINSWTEGYAGIARPIIMHRSRADTIASKHTQRHELLDVLPNRLEIDNNLKKWIYKEKEDAIKEGIINFLQAKLNNLVPRVNVLYTNRKTSALSGIKWPDIAESQYLTDRLYKLTVNYLESAISTLEKEHWMIIPDATSLAIRARNAIKIDPALIVYGPAHNIELEYEKDRSRLAFFAGGPSSVNALQKGYSIEYLKRKSQHSFIKFMADLGLPRDFITLYNRRGWIYEDIWNELKKGNIIVAFDGKAWEASSALMMGKYGSPFGTPIRDYLLLTSGNFATSVINTACVGMTNEFFGVFDAGFRAYGAGDDDNIVCKPEEASDVQKLFWNVEFMEFQPMDTLMQYFLGFTFLDLKHPHSMGLKLTRDSAGSYQKLHHNLEGWAIDEDPNFLWKTFTEQEVKAYRLVFTDVSQILPKLDMFIEGLEYFSPHWLIENLPKHKRREEANLSFDPSPDRDTKDIFDRYLIIKDIIPAEHYEDMIVGGMV